MEVRRLDVDDLVRIGEIDRSEHVEQQWAVIDGALVDTPIFIVDIPVWDPVGEGEFSVAAQVAFCRPIVERGATLLGAFDDCDDLMGLAIVDPTFEPPMAWLAWLHVSRRHRQRGAATVLWATAAGLARAGSASTMYVSATPTGSAVGFYLSRGCTLADPVHPALFAHEPEDIHLVVTL